MRDFFQAVIDDPDTQKVILHVERSIVAREFQDFSIWLNQTAEFQGGPFVRKLTPETLNEAWPPNLSLKVRIMADAYLDPEMLAA